MFHDQSSHSSTHIPKKDITWRSPRDHSLKHLASTSPSLPVAVSVSKSGSSAPLQIGSFWSRQNCRVQDKHGCLGLVGL